MHTRRRQRGDPFRQERRAHEGDVVRGEDDDALATPRPVVVPHSPEWAARAAALIADLRAGLGPTALRFEHIGSTALPGMDAKPVLDLQVSVALEEAASAWAEVLADRGFERFAAASDHVPTGSDDDPARWRKLVWFRRGAGDDVNLHVRTVGSPNERLALLFRDWFRAHPVAVPAYAAFKRALADVVPDAAAYADVKDPVVDLVIVMAEEWAAAVGWEP